MNTMRPKRKHPRLKTYDYHRPGAYFVTICTQNRICVLSDINVGRGLAPAELQLTQYGKIAEDQLLLLETRYSTVRVDKYVIMPNHIHIIVRLQEDAAGASPRPTLSDVICTFKSQTTRLCKQIRPISKLFQTSFHDHVIRGETDYNEIWRYIDNNPAEWTRDEFYTA